MLKLMIPKWMVVVRRRESTVSRTPASLSRCNDDGEYRCDDRSLKKKKKKRSG